MGTTIFYYSGTGNSLWVARRFAAQLEEARLVSMSQWDGAIPAADSRVIGLVFPVYIWGVPAPVRRFIKRLKNVCPDYTFAAAVNGGQVSGTLLQLRKLLSDQGIELASGFSFVMPSNYIPWGGPGSPAYQQELFVEAGRKIEWCAQAVSRRDISKIEKGPLWQRMLFFPIYRFSFAHVPKFDAKFYADGKCNHCGICVQLCPAENITLEQGIPVWHHRCDQCFACLQWCPQTSIQYGKRTMFFDRYHHPEVSLKDMLKKQE